MRKSRVTAHTVQVMNRAKLGRTRTQDLTPEDLQAIADRKAEQEARLARIAEGNKQES